VRTKKSIGPIPREEQKDNVYRSMYGKEKIRRKIGRKRTLEYWICSPLIASPT
jgi:hypothetical protein